MLVSAGGGGGGGPRLPFRSRQGTRFRRFSERLTTREPPFGRARALDDEVDAAAGGGGGGGGSSESWGICCFVDE